MLRRGVGADLFGRALSTLPLLLRFVFVSMGASSGSAAGTFFFFFLEVFVAGTGEDTAGLIGLLGFAVVSGTDSAAAEAGSESREFSWLGLFSFAEEAEAVNFGWFPFFPFFRATSFQPSSDLYFKYLSKYLVVLP